MIDAVTFQVLQSRLSGIVQEMQEHIFRTGYSTVIRESQDASCMILDVEGAVVGEHVVLPLHVSALPAALRAVRAAFGDDIGPGDAFITNDPYVAGVPHAMDMAIVSPVFHRGRLVAFCGSIAHKSDLGGMVAGSANATATDMFQECIQYPPLRFVRAGEIVRDVEAILRANSRTPDLILGDIRGQVGVGRLGEIRLNEMFDRYGIDAALEAFAHKQNVTEARVRAELARWPDGEHEAESFLDGTAGQANSAIRFHVRVTKRGSRIRFDFSGSDDQSRSPINIRPPLVHGCIYYALIATIDPQLSNNGGVARVVETTFRPGSVLDPAYPAACNTYMPTALGVTETCLRALSGFVPSRRMAGVGGSGAVSVGGNRADGTRFVQYDLGGSAYGGRAVSDGPSGIAVLLSNARSAPIEVIESEYPTRIRRFELVPDSGGAGTYRGGLAARREYEILADTASVTLRASGHDTPAFGRDGGLPGRTARCTLNAGTPGERHFPSRFSGLALTRGDVLTVDKGGGGGLGDPAGRDFQRIVDDVLDGYVSREATHTEYGIAPERLERALDAWEPVALSNTR